MHFEAVTGEERTNLFRSCPVAVGESSGHIVLERSLLQQLRQPGLLDNSVSLIGDLQCAPKQGVARHQRHERNPAGTKDAS